MTTPEHTSDIEHPMPPRPVLRRRPVQIAIALLVLLLLALTPPLINVSRLRLRIASNMSRSLGRPVHLDRVSIHLLPMPGFTLENLVVSEDPAFGYEPVIRANQVEATLRVSSLWRRHVEFSTIRFIVDPNGSAPSVNIVRNAQGRWNLEDILMQAAHTEAAPTAQPKAGPTPRFPYIEATGARINLKLSDEKMPFSLTEADFALWLPSPEQWHVRLQGKPARTDTNANDTGVVRLEGTLGRATKLSDVPLDLTASWAHAQMGEAAKLLTGNDAGWRGTVETGARLTGQLGAAKLTADLHLTDLRRADFVPAKLLDISAHCSATANLAIVTLSDATCAIPDGAADPIVLSASTVDLQKPTTAPATIALHQMPLTWALDWARLFSQHIPESTQPIGSLDGDLTWTSTEPVLPHPDPQPRGWLPAPDWHGGLKSTFISATTGENTYDFATSPITADWAVEIAFGTTSRLASITLFTVTATAPQSLVITFTPDRTLFTFQGKATQSQLAAIGDAILPPLGGNATAALPASAPATALTLNLQCSLPADQAHPCTNTTAPPVPAPKPHRKP